MKIMYNTKWEKRGAIEILVITKIISKVSIYNFNLKIFSIGPPSSEIGFFFKKRDGPCPKKWSLKNGTERRYQKYF